MKTITVLVLTLIPLIVAQPLSQDETDEILQQTKSADPETKTYKFSFQTSNGITRNEQSERHASIDGQDVFAVSGESKHFSPEGDEIEISYRADENGYVASGPSIPVAPPIPEEILKGIELSVAAENARNAAKTG